jgi:hypothetical protein
MKNVANQDNMKIIHINADHYIIVDDSEIKEGDYFINESKTIEVGASHYNYKTLSPECKKITYSTKRLGGNDDFEFGADNTYPGTNVKSITLEQVLEMEYFQQLEKRREVAKNFKGQVAGRHPDMFTSSEMQHMIAGYMDGYNKALENNRDKKWTDADVIRIVEITRRTGLIAEYVMLSIQSIEQTR